MSSNGNGKRMHIPPAGQHGGMARGHLEYTIEGADLVAFQVIADLAPKRIGVITLDFLTGDWLDNLETFKDAMFEIFRRNVERATGCSIVAEMTPEEAREMRARRMGGAS